MSAPRKPAWSEPLALAFGDVIPESWGGAALTGIKAIHTVIFASIATAILVFVWDGIRQRPGRRAAYALGLAMAETGVYLSNNQVCPLTPLAQQFGDERGTVTDMFLPPWAARRIPLGASVALLVGLVLNGRAALHQAQARSGRPRSEWAAA